MNVTIEFNNTGLLHRIKNASSKQELLSLMEEGSEYRYAKEETRRKWERATIIRISELLENSEAKKTK